MNCKRFLAAVLTLVLVLSIFPTVTRATESDLVTDSSNYNIAIVVDSSGSLKQGITSDPNGYRYDAIGMFFDLMSDSGSNVCAVVFKGNSDVTDASDSAMRKEIQCFPKKGMQAISSQADKDSLLTDIKSVTPRGYTDIGTALLMAAERLDGLTKQNGKKSIIVLFTDGATEFPKGAPAAITQASEQNKQEALDIIRGNGITLCAVYLNRDSKYYSPEVANLVRASLNSNPEIANSITDKELENTKQYHLVSNGASLPGVFQSFYELISPTNLQPLDKNDTFTIPGAGVDELNILITTNGSFDIAQTRLTQLTHETEGPMDSAELLSLCSLGQTYAVYKLTNPTEGDWTVQWQSPDTNAKCYLMMNTDISAQVTMEPTPEKVKYNDDVTITANLVSQGKAITKSSQYAKYRCMLEIIDTFTDEKIVEEELFLDGSGHFSYLYPADRFGSFSVQVVFTCGEDIQIAADPQPLEIDNDAPDTDRKSSSVHIATAFGSGGTSVLSLDEYILDEDPLSALTIVPTSDNSYPAEAFVIAPDNSTLTLYGRTGGDGTLRLMVSDALGSHATLELTITCTDYTLLILLVLLAACIAAAIFVFKTKRRNKQTLVVSGMVTFSIPVTDVLFIDITLPAMECLNKNLGIIFTERIRRLIAIASENPRLRQNAAGLIRDFIVDNEELLRACRVSALPGMLGRPNKLQLSSCGSNQAVVLDPRQPSVLELSGGRKLRITYR